MVESPTGLPRKVEASACKILVSIQSRPSSSISKKLMACAATSAVMAPPAFTWA